MSNKYAELKDVLMGKFDAEEVEPLKLPTKEQDNMPEKFVEHPPHYNQGTYETIDIIEDWDLGFHCGNAIKYISRHKHKGQPIRDIKKAIWYLNRYLDSMEGQK